ncbi:hypothetical protein LSAT2_006002, partial [Lamellibrachia satsuma]
ALKLMPSDVSENTSCLTPVSVSADGNCLPRSGSVLAFGHENLADEIRTRFFIELELNEDYNTNGSFLRQGGEFDDKGASSTTRGRVRRQGGEFDDKTA